MKNHQNNFKVIGKVPAAQWAIISERLNRVEALEKSDPSNHDGIKCYVQDASQIDILKMILPSNTMFRIVG